MTETRLSIAGVVPTRLFYPSLFKLHLRSVQTPKNRAVTLLTAITGTLTRMLSSAIITCHFIY